MGLAVPLFTEIGLRGLVRGSLGSGKGVAFNGKRFTGVARRLITRSYQNHVRVTSGSWLLGSSEGQLGNSVRGSLGLAGNLLIKGTGSQRGLFAGLQRASINGWRCVVSALLVSGLSRKGSMWP